MTPDQIYQYLTDPRELPDDVRDELERPVVRAIIATGLAADAGMSLDEEDWLTSGLMNDFEQGGIPADAQAKIVAKLLEDTL